MKTILVVLETDVIDITNDNAKKALLKTIQQCKQNSLNPDYQNIRIVFAALSFGGTELEAKNFLNNLQLGASPFEYPSAKNRTDPIPFIRKLVERIKKTDEDEDEETDIAHTILVTKLDTQTIASNSSTLTTTSVENLTADLNAALNANTKKDSTIEEQPKKSKKDLDKFKKLAKQTKSLAAATTHINDIITHAITMIGAESETALKPAFKTDHIAGYKDKKFGERFSLDQKKQLVKLAGYVYFVDPTTDIDGITRHPINNRLFSSVTPFAGFYHKLTATTATEAAAQEKILAAQYRNRMIDMLAKLYPNKKPTFIVLGDAAAGMTNKGENIEAYCELWEEAKPIDEKPRQFKHYELSKTATQASQDIDITYINAHGKILHATQADLHYLVTLANRSFGSNSENTHPILVHCQQGLDRTGKIVLALETMRCMDHFFGLNNPLSTKEIAQAITKAFSILRKARSPIALGKTDDFKHAVYLGLLLALYKMEQHCYHTLADKSDIEQKDTEHHKKSQKGTLLKECADNLLTLNSYQEKLDCIDIYLKKPEVSTHRNRATSGATKVKEFFGSAPIKTTSVERLEALREIIDTIQTAEKTLVDAAKANGLTLFEEEKVVPANANTHSSVSPPMR